MRECYALLVPAGLPVDDLEEDHLEHFRGVEVRGQLVALGGVEVHGPVGLLRSFATESGHRGLGLASLILKAVEVHVTCVNADGSFLPNGTPVFLFKMDGTGGRMPNAYLRKSARIG